jgi:signal transduction histidine kinase
MIQAIGFLTLFIQSVLIAFFFHSILIPRFKPVLSGALLVLIVLIPYLADFIYPLMQWLKTVVNFAVVLVLVLLLYSSSFKQKLLAFMVFFIVNSIAELTATGIVILGFGNRFSDVAKPGIDMNVLRGFYILIVTVLYLLTIFLWHRKKTGRINFQNFAAFTIFPVSQIFLLEGTFTAYDNGGENYLIIYTAMGILLATLANLYLFKLINQLMRKAELEKRILQLEQHQRMGFEHLKELEAIDRYNRTFHHDISNQLSVIQILLQSGQHKQASDMITSLSNDIHVYDSKKYCSHPVVNAVLAQKSMLAGLSNIEFDAEVYVSEHSSIQSIDLCSVFSNLLDNAIEACNAPLLPQTRKYIEVKAGLKREYLTIKVKNAKINEIKTKNNQIMTSKADPQMHGLGLSIVHDIAKKYDGDFSVNYTYDTFTAVVLLKDRSASDQLRKVMTPETV